MVKHFIILLALAAGSQDVLKTPDMPDAHRYKIQSIAARRQVIESEEERVKLQYQLLEAQKAALNADLTRAIADTYRDTKVDDNKWAINDDGNWVPKPKEKK